MSTDDDDKERPPRRPLGRDEGDPPYLTKAELAAKARLAASTIQRYKDQQKIPYFQPFGKGGRLLFPPNAVEIARRLNASGNTTGSCAEAPPATPTGPPSGPAAPAPRKLPGPRARRRARRQEN